MNCDLSSARQNKINHLEESGFISFSANLGIIIQSKSYYIN
jgi:hypothetical protein